MSPTRIEQLVAAWRDRGESHQEAIDWSRAKPNWRRDLPTLAEFISELPSKLNRTLIGEIFDNPDNGIDAKFTTVMIWGYGAVGYGSFRTKRMFASPDFQLKLEKSSQLSQSEQPLAAYRYLSKNKIDMLGPAFGTKWISFASPRSNPAPIYDSFISKWFQHFAADVFAQGPVSSLPWNPSTYSIYLNWMLEQSRLQDMKCDALELLIFQDAMQTFPNSSKWKNL
jgi:hypothetical protein